MHDIADEVHQLRAQLTALQQRLSEMEARADSGSSTSVAPIDDHERAGRRNFIRLAAGAVVGGAAAGLATTASPAAATTNSPVLLGETNVPSSAADKTLISNPSLNDLAPVLFELANYSSATLASPSTWRVAMHAVTADHDTTIGQRIAVAGEATAFSNADRRGIGVLGTANRVAAPTLPTEAVGVAGFASAGGSRGPGTGVKGWVVDGDTSIGVHGLTVSSVGVRAEATATGGVGLDAIAPLAAVAARVHGRLRQTSSATAGAPTFSALAGEQWRDSRGDMYICVATGSPGTWRKVAAQHPAYGAAGGSINFLHSPIRLLDTRPTGVAPQKNGGKAVQPATDLIVAITGVKVGAVSVPAGATGVIGTITAITPTANGSIVLRAENIAVPNASNLTFAKGVNVANGFTCALSPAGKLRVRASVATHVVLDVVAFVY